MFTQLHIHTQFSTLDGIASSHQYAEKAFKLNHKSLAITDHGKMTGVYYHQMACLEYGLKPIFGVEMYLSDNLVELNEKNKRTRTKNNHLILLTKNEIGFKNLLKLNYLSMKDEEHFYYTNRITEEELFAHSDGIIVGTACLQSKWGQLIRKDKIKEAEKLFEKYVKHFGENFYAEVQLNELIEEGQKKVNDNLIRFAEKYNVLIVLTGDVHYLEPEDEELQRVSINIRDKTTEKNKKFEIESKHLYYHDEKDYIDFNKKFNYNYDNSKIIEWANNSIKIADKCNYLIPERKEIFLPTLTNNDDDTLIKKSKKALYVMFENNPPEEYKKRLSHELEVIIRKGFSSYVLILEDILRYVKERGSLQGVGRGSGGGSLILYLLGITKLNPIEYGLLFERFMSDSRSIDTSYKWIK
jgi:DNA polymerase III subunit alpha